MKKSVTVLILLLLFALPLIADQTATTQDGRLVILHDDGTWEYAEVHPSMTSLKHPYIKSERATSLYKGEIVPYELWVDKSRWKQAAQGENPDAEYEFEHVNTILYGVVIAERLYIPLGGLKKIVLDNARKAAPGASVVFEQPRIVNGMEVFSMLIDVPIEEYQLNFKFYYYLYSKKSYGTVQVLCYTLDEEFEEFEEEMIEFLNGFVVGE